MILQSTDTLEEYVGNKYALVILAAKRARQLKEGHAPLARDASPNPLSLALREVAEHRLSPIAPPEEELAPAPRDVIASLIAGAEFDLDDELDLDSTDAVDDLAALLAGTDDEEEEIVDADPDLLTPAVGAADEVEEEAADEAEEEVVEGGDEEETEEEEDDAEEEADDV